NPLEPLQRARVREPEEVAAALEVFLDRLHLAVEQAGARTGDDEGGGVLRDRRVLGERERARLEAALAELRGPGREVEIRLALGAALAVARDEDEPALAAMAEARERVRQVFLGERGRRDVLVRVAVGDHHLAVIADTRRAHALGLDVRVDELERDVRLVALIALDHLADRRTDVAALA